LGNTYGGFFIHGKKPNTLPTFDKFDGYKRRVVDSLITSRFYKYNFQNHHPWPLTRNQNKSRYIIVRTEDCDNHLTYITGSTLIFRQVHKGMCEYGCTIYKIQFFQDFKTFSVRHLTPLYDRTVYTFLGRQWD